MNTWSTIRVTLVTIAFLGGFSSLPPVSPEEVSIWLLLGVFVFGVLGMLFVIGIQRINPRSAPTWRYPSWSINPFSLREPLQFFHLGGFFMLASGVGLQLRMLVVDRMLWSSAYIFLAFGAGILGGVYACTVIYRSKMTRT